MSTWLLIIWVSVGTTMQDYAISGFENRFQCEKFWHEVLLPSAVTKEVSHLCREEWDP